MTDALVEEAQIGQPGDKTMPKGTKVERCYRKVRKAGAGKGKAAAVCQKSTGQALATGKRPKRSQARGR